MTLRHNIAPQRYGPLHDTGHDMTMIDLAAAHPTLTRLLDYWRGKGGDTALPGRDAIVPFEVMPLLPHLIMLTLADRDPRVDWTGTGVKDACGRDIAERPLRDTPLWDNRLDAAVAAAVAGSPVLIEGRFSRADGQDWSHQLLLLPLAADGRRVDALLGGLIVRPA